MAQLDLSQKFPFMKPIKSPPALFRINGCGMALYGHRDDDAHTGTYIATWCLSLIFVPVFCLRAYRVIQAASGSWYFVGREPLSLVARLWNLVLILAIAGTIGGVRYHNYTTSPQYIAGKKMEQAREQAAKGQIAQAAKTFAALAVVGRDEADNAATALQGLIEEKCAGAALSESAGVYAAAVQVTRSGRTFTASDLVSRAQSLVSEKGASDARAAVELLDAVRPLAVNSAPVDALRLKFLRQWASAEPGNLNVLVPLASLLEEQQKADEAKGLLLPVKGQLGDGEGARVLGKILAREGDYDGAYALLWPYVKSRLESLHSATGNLDGVMKSIWDREIELLDQNKGPADFYSQYQSASKEQRQAMVQEYVSNRIRNDPSYTAAQQDLERHAAVVPVALELGMIMLERAQRQGDAQVRKSQLEAAKEVFLAIGGVAGETDTYRVTLGQIHYWLGEHDKGHKLFEEFLASKSRDHRSLLQIGTMLRQVGLTAETRILTEEAYNKASENEERYQAAAIRAVCSVDLEDEILWLNRCNVSIPEIKARLAKVQGDKAMLEGRDDEAAAQYRTVIDAYASMPRSATTLNESALAYYSLFEATGERQAFERCLDHFQQAVNLKPSDTVLLFNAGSTLLSGALTDILSEQIDLRALHESGSVSLLGYLYRDQAGRERVVARVREHPGVARALAYLQKVCVLAPKDAKSFEIIFQVHSFNRDLAALTALEERIRSSQLDHSDHLQRVRDAIKGTRDQQHRTRLTSSLKRQEALANKLRPRGGMTAAVAIGQQVSLMLGMDHFTHDQDLSKAVTLAEEARRLAPSASADGLLVACLYYQLAAELRKSDASFDAYCKRFESCVSLPHLIAWVASRPGSHQQKVIGHPLFKQSLPLLRDELTRLPDGTSSYEWALLSASEPAIAEQAAGIIRGSKLQLLRQNISSLLTPASASEALETYWLMQIHGKAEEGRRALKAVSDLSIPVPSE